MRMKYNEANQYTNIVTTVYVDGSDNPHNQKRTQEYLNLKCPHCTHEGWVDNGNVEDMTKNDIENARCNSCGEEFFLTYMDEYFNDGEFNSDPTDMENKSAFPDLMEVL